MKYSRKNCIVKTSNKEHLKASDHIFTISFWWWQKTSYRADDEPLKWIQQEECQVNQSWDPIGEPHSFQEKGVFLKAFQQICILCSTYQLQEYTAKQKYLEVADIVCLLASNKQPRKQKEDSSYKKLLTRLKQKYAKLCLFYLRIDPWQNSKAKIFISIPIKQEWWSDTKNTLQIPRLQIIAWSQIIYIT